MASIKNFGSQQCWNSEADDGGNVMDSTVKNGANLTKDLNFTMPVL